MYQILETLNKTSGITGSMLVGDDGIVIAADLNTAYEEETIGALAASIMSNIGKSMERLENIPLVQVTIEADNAKMFFCDAGIGILVVVAETNVNIGLVRLEIKHAIAQLKTQKAAVESE